jgi:hypothetical protein
MFQFTWFLAYFNVLVSFSALVRIMYYVNSFILGTAWMKTFNKGADTKEKLVYFAI